VVPVSLHGGSLGKTGHLGGSLPPGGLGLFVGGAKPNSEERQQRLELAFWAMHSGLLWPMDAPAWCQRHPGMNEAHLGAARARGQEGARQQAGHPGRVVAGAARAAFGTLPGVSRSVSWPTKCSLGEQPVGSLEQY